MIKGLTMRNQRLPPAVIYAVTIRCITVAGRGEVVFNTKANIDGRCIELIDQGICN